MQRTAALARVPAERRVSAGLARCCRAWRCGSRARGRNAPTVGSTGACGAGGASAGACSAFSRSRQLVLPARSRPSSSSRTSVCAVRCVRQREVSVEGGAALRARCVVAGALRMCVSAARALRKRYSYKPYSSENMMRRSGGAAARGGRRGGRRAQLRRRKRHSSRAQHSRTTPNCTRYAARTERAFAMRASSPQAGPTCRVPSAARSGLHGDLSRAHCAAMEALPGFAAAAEAEDALALALSNGGFRNAAFAVVSAAREARACLARAWGVQSGSRAASPQRARNQH